MVLAFGVLGRSNCGAGEVRVCLSVGHECGSGRIVRMWKMQRCKCGIDGGSASVGKTVVGMVVCAVWMWVWVWVSSRRLPHRQRREWLQIKNFHLFSFLPK